MSIHANRSGGTADQRVTFQRNYGVRSASGATPADWRDLKECWAAVDGEKASGERYIADGVRSISDYTVWIRADIVSRFSLSVRDRMLWRGKAYDIKDLPDQQLRGKWAAVIVRAGVNQG